MISSLLRIVFEIAPPWVKWALTAAAVIDWVVIPAAIVLCTKRTINSKGTTPMINSLARRRRVRAHLRRMTEPKPGPLMLRNITAGRAVVCDRRTGWPIAEIERDAESFTFPGYGTTVTAVWRVSVAGHELAADRTRAGAVRAAVPALSTHRLLRTDTAA